MKSESGRELEHWTGQCSMTKKENEKKGNIKISVYDVNCLGKYLTIYVNI